MFEKMISCWASMARVGFCIKIWTSHNFCCYFLMFAMIDDKCPCTLIGFHLTPPSFPSKWFKIFMVTPLSIQGIANITPNSSKQNHALVCARIGLEYRFKTSINNGFNIGSEDQINLVPISFTILDLILRWPNTSFEKNEK